MVHKPCWVATVAAHNVGRRQGRFWRIPAMELRVFTEQEDDARLAAARTAHIRLDVAPWMPYLRATMKCITTRRAVTHELG